MRVSRDFMAPQAGAARLHGLDAVRACALLLGVFYHATLAYLPGSAIWPVEDDHRSALLSVAFFVSHMFRMTTFFLIAGFFARMSVEKRGVKAFVKDRAKRILLPLVVGWPIMLAAIVAVSVLGVYMATGHIPGPPPRNPHAPPLAVPLTHLWFLYLLLLLYVTALRWRAVVLWLDRSGRFRAAADRALAVAVKSPLAPAVFAAPVALAFYFGGPWVAWLGVPTPDSSLLPNLPALVQFFAAFGCGWLLHRQTGLLDVLTRRWPLNLAIAVAATIACLSMLGLAPRLEFAQPGLKTAACAAAYAIGAWSWTFAVIGLAMRYLSEESAVRRYLADSSYWLYLVHLPLVMLLQALLTRLNLPAELKVVLLLAIAFPLLLASYQLLVRHSVIGAILNGRRVENRRRQAIPATAHPEPAE